MIVEETEKANALHEISITIRKISIEKLLYATNSSHLHSIFSKYSTELLLVPPSIHMHQNVQQLKGLKYNVKKILSTRVYISKSSSN